MSTTVLAPAGNFDDFAAWQTELNQSELEPLSGPRLPHHPNRAESNRAASAQIDEGFAEWLNGRRN